MSAENIAERALAVLASNPTSSDLNFLVTAHAAIGYLAATAETDAEMAEAKRKHIETEAYLKAKHSAIEKMTDKEATAMSEVAAWDHKQAEVTAYGRARKLKNLLSSLTEAINAVKFLGRYDSSTVKFPTS